MNKEEALRLAHEGVEIHSPNAPEYKVCAALIAALEAKDEPYAYIYETDSPFGLHQSLRHEPYNGRMPDRTVPVYTTPPQQ